MTTNFTLDNLSDAILDVRDIIEYYESLDENSAEELEEKEFIKENILDELKGNGDDEEWQGDWYPVTLVAERYFEEYAMELAYDCYDVPNNNHWPYNHIDWAAAANELLEDYCEINIKYDSRNYSFYF